MIAIIDYGMGNHGSILNMMKHLGIEAIVTGDSAVLADATKLVLPGVGAFDEGIRRIEELGLRSVLDELVLKDCKPILGICLGMQLIFDRSEEGQAKGLGWIPGEVVRFQLEDAKLKVPHMGWNYVLPNHHSSIFHVPEAEYRFYFVHSYHAVCEDTGHVLGTTEHGHSFASAVQNGHILGTQFHPEKSHKYGMRLLKSFAELPFDE